MGGLNLPWRKISSKIPITSLSYIFKTWKIEILCSFQEIYEDNKLHFVTAPTCIQRLTLVKNHTGVSYVWNHLLTVLTWKCTWEPILVKNHTGFSYVRNPFLKLLTWRYTWVPILVKNHTLASYVRSLLLSVIPWKLIW